MSIGRLFKDPDATLDYTVDWTDWLADGEVIASAEWIIDPEDDLGIEAEGHDDETHTVWLSGGTAGVRYAVTSRITTDSTPPRVDNRTFALVIKDQ